MRISEQIIEPLLIHEKISHLAALERGIAMLSEVGVPDAGESHPQLSARNFPAACVSA